MKEWKVETGKPQGIRRKKGGHDNFPPEYNKIGFYFILMVPFTHSVDYK